MVISRVEEVSAGCIKIITESGPSFFIHSSYLSLVPPEQIVSGSVFIEEKEDDIINAGLAFAVEKKALEYLSRAEQSRAGLYRKLKVKKFEKTAIDKALDHLESASYLSDMRFARAWLNNRKITHSEGRSKLACELAARGIDKETSATALDEFFAQNDERDACIKALEKCRRLKKDQNKTLAALLRAGFSYNLIRDVLPAADTEFI